MNISLQIRYEHVENMTEPHVSVDKSMTIIQVKVFVSYNAKRATN